METTETCENVKKRGRPKKVKRGRPRKSDVIDVEKENSSLSDTSAQRSELLDYSINDEAKDDEEVEAGEQQLLESSLEGQERRVKGEERGASGENINETVDRDEVVEEKNTEREADLHVNVVADCGILGTGEQTFGMDGTFGSTVEKTRGRPKQHHSDEDNDKSIEERQTNLSFMADDGSLETEEKAFRNTQTPDSSVKKKRGRPRKQHGPGENKGKDTGDRDIEQQRDLSLVDDRDNLEMEEKIFGMDQTPGTTAKRKRGRPPKQHNLHENGDEVIDKKNIERQADLNLVVDDSWGMEEITPGSTGKRQRGKPKRYSPDAERPNLNKKIDTKGTGSGKKRGRPRKIGLESVETEDTVERMDAVKEVNLGTEQENFLMQAVQLESVKNGRTSRNSEDAEVNKGNTEQISPSQGSITSVEILNPNSKDPDKDSSGTTQNLSLSYHKENSFKDKILSPGFPVSGKKRGRPPLTPQSARGGKRGRPAFTPQSVSGKKRGPGRPKRVKVEIEEEWESPEFIPYSKHSTPYKTGPRTKRVCQTKGNNSYFSDVSEGDHASRRSGRERKKRSFDNSVVFSDDEDSDESDREDELLAQEDQLEERLTKRPGRKRKRQSYKDFDDTYDYEESSGGQIEDEDRKQDLTGDTDEPSEQKNYKTKRISSGAAKRHVGRPRKRKKISHEDSDTDDYVPEAEERGETLEDTEEEHKTKGKLKCPRCTDSKHFAKERALVTHMAVHHQAHWSPEYPEGSTDAAHMLSVIKIKKFLNCPKCEKRFNFLQYYRKHVEFCGKETETFQCEICSRQIRIMWQREHVLVCQRRKAKEEENIQKIKQREDEEEREKAEGGDGRRKRSAAKKAQDLLHNLSKSEDVATTDDVDDRDPDVKLDQEQEEEEEDYIDDDAEDLEDEVSDLKAPARKSSNEVVRQPRKLDQDRYQSCEQVLNLVQKKLSGEIYAELLPVKSEWSPLSQSASTRYLPQVQRSADFKMGPRNNLQHLDLFEAQNVQNGVSFFVGQSISHAEWCPTPYQSSVEQYLAVCGTDFEEERKVLERFEGPGLIQIWNMKVSNNKTLKQTCVPEIAFGIAHDFGHITDMKWCPSGCWQGQTKSEVESEGSLPRLGLLAISTTDACIHVFSVPNLQTESDVTGQVTVYKPNPVMTLVPHRKWQTANLTCCCLSWQAVSPHRYIIGGYSDGTVRIFDFHTTSPLLLTPMSTGCQLLPFRSFYAHHREVTACDWSFMAPSHFVTGSLDRTVKFWTLEDTSVPYSSDTDRLSMVYKLQWPYLFHGITSSADEIYSYGSNKCRYIECCNIRRQTASEEKHKYTLVFFSSHHATVWNNSFSNWLQMSVACDNKGQIVSSPVPHLVDYNTDTKSLYKIRLYFLRTSLKWKKDQKVKNNVSRKAGDKQNQADIMTKEEEYTLNQSQVKTVETAGQSDQCNCEKDSQSQVCIIKCKNCIANQIQGEVDSKTQTGSQLAHGNSTARQKHSPAVNSQPNSGPGAGSSSLPQTYREMTEKMFLQYIETVQNRAHPPPPTLDQKPDSINHYQLCAQKVVSMNPNRFTCCWLVYGGNAGIMRLTNVYNILFRKVQENVQKFCEEPS